MCGKFQSNFLLRNSNTHSTALHNSPHNDDEIHTIHVLRFHPSPEFSLATFQLFMFTRQKKLLSFIPRTTKFQTGNAGKFGTRQHRRSARNFPNFPKTFHSFVDKLCRRTKCFTLKLRLESFEIARKKVSISCESINLIFSWN